MKQSTAGQKVAAVDFTTMPYEANTTHLAEGKPYFAIFVPELMTLPLSLKM